MVAKKIWIESYLTFSPQYHYWWPSPINSLVPGKFEWNFRYVIFKQIFVIDSWGISCEIAQIWMSLDFTDAITWANVDPDLCRHMASLGHNEFSSKASTHITLNISGSCLYRTSTSRYVVNAPVTYFWLLGYTTALPANGRKTETFFISVIAHIFLL